MNTRSIFKTIAVAAVAFLPAAAAEASASSSPSIIVVDDDDQPPATEPALAWFEGKQIDLTKGWGRATACAVTEAEVRCFRNENQMNRYLGVSVDSAATEAQAATSSFTASALTCSSSVRLYDGSYFAGSVLSVAIQWSYINLANYGWDNRTSSYTIGACGADFFSGAWGSGTVFGATWAWAQVGYMGGWSNALSSVYIY